MHYDVIIIGGGPSGSTLGVLLKKADISVCIIDKAKFPREKLCGGLLTKKSLLKYFSIFGHSTVDQIEKTIPSAVSFHYLSGKCMTKDNEDDRYCIVDRAQFDNALVKRFLELKGTLYENISDYEIDYSNRTVCFQGKTISYTFLVGADGANSRVRQQHFPPYSPNGFCVQGKMAKIYNDNSIHIYWKATKDGYGWIFPCINKAIVGIGSATAPKYIMDDYAAMLEKACIDKDQMKIKGARIAFGNYVKRPLVDCTILIGDAAGLVDPITGEGLYYAALSATYAFNHIQGNGKGNIYNRKVRNIHAKIVFHRFLKKIFYYEFINRVYLSISHKKRKCVLR